LLQVSVKDHLFCALGQLKHKLHKAWSRKKAWIPKQQQYRQFPALIDHIKQNWCFKERLSPQLSSGGGLLACLLARLLIQDVQRMCCCQVAFSSFHKIKSKSRISSSQDVQNMLLPKKYSCFQKIKSKPEHLFLHP